MKYFATLMIVLFSYNVCAQTSHPDLRKYSGLLNADIYAGFGLARDLINHVYMGSPFAPRDYDLAIVGSDLSEEQAITILSEHGSIVKTIQMYREEMKPNGNVFGYHFGFVIIVEAQGTQIDFKFFNSVEDAHTRGLFDVEKVLIPLNNRLLSQMVKDLKQHKELGTPFEMSDPHNGFESILTRNPKTVNWANARGSSLSWIIRGAMINAKLGDSTFNKSERKLMIEQLKQVQYIREKELALIRRAIAHKRSWRVKELLSELGFFKYVKNWRWNESALELIENWKSKPASFSCAKII